MAHQRRYGRRITPSIRRHVMIDYDRGIVFYDEPGIRTGCFFSVPDPNDALYAKSIALFNKIAEAIRERQKVRRERV